MSKARPTSPHLTIYRPQISSVMSILHRMTGVGLFVSLSIFCWWEIILIFSNFDAAVIEYAYHPLAKLLAILTSFATCYHLCTGIRHLFWDSGKGFSIKQLHLSGWLAIITAALLFAAFWIIICK